MDPLTQFCHNPDCPARGQPGLGNIRAHSRKERRYRCTTCGRTFAVTRDTPYYRLKKSADRVTLVITLLCHGCPVQAIVAGLSGSTSGPSPAGPATEPVDSASRLHEHRRPSRAGGPGPCPGGLSCTPRSSAGPSGWRWRWPSRRGSGWAVAQRAARPRSWIKRRVVQMVLACGGHEGPRRGLGLWSTAWRAT